jgi:hypothetical protein
MVTLNNIRTEKSILGFLYQGSKINKFMLFISSVCGQTQKQQITHGKELSCVFLSLFPAYQLCRCSRFSVQNEATTESGPEENGCKGLV